LNGTVWTAQVSLIPRNPGDYYFEFYRYEPSGRNYVFLRQQLVNVPNTLPQSFTFTHNVDLRAGERLGVVAINRAPGIADATSELSLNSLSSVLETVAPKVTNVRLDGAFWSSGPLVYSYASIVQTGKQLAPIYTQNVDQLQVVFNERVQESQLTAANVKLFRGNNVEVPLPALLTHAYDLVSHTATWTFASPLPADKYRLEISTTGVADLFGNKLDGEWLNLANGTFDNFADDVMGRTFQVGNGNPGAPDNAFKFAFSLLPGDYNQDGLVTSADAVAGTVKDGDGDGVIENASDGDDTAIATANNGLELSFRARHGGLCHQ
jgi:Bacterial Ig-like domain